MLSQTSEYALRAVVHLATQGPGARMQAADLAAALDVPANYLSKILHQLATAGVLVSRRGRNGGFALARPASRTTIERVITPFGPISGVTTCVLGERICSDRTACGAHSRWKPIAESTRAFIRGTTIAELAPPDTGK